MHDDSSSAWSPTARLGESWVMVRQAPALLWVGGLLRACTAGGGGGGGGSGEDQASRPAPDGPEAWLGQADALDLGSQAVAVVGILAVLTLVFVFGTWILAGWIRLHRELFDTGSGRFATLFSGMDVLLPLLGWRLVAGACLLGAALPGMLGIVGVVAWSTGEPDLAALGVVVGLAMVPLLYVLAGIQVGDRLVVLDGRGPLEALRGSWDLARGRRWTLLWFLLVVSLGSAALGVAGVLACLVGLVVTVPLSWALKEYALTAAWLRFQRGWVA